MTISTPNNIKDIDPQQLVTVASVDAALESTNTASARIATQMDYKLEGGVKQLRDLEPDERRWFLGAKAAKRYAKATIRALLHRREALIFGANDTLAGLRRAIDLAMGKTRLSEPVHIIAKDGAEAKAWGSALDALVSEREQPAIQKETDHADA